MNRLVTGIEGAPLARWGFLGDDFDRVFEGFFRPMRSVEEATSESITPAMDIIERQNDYVVRADLPGVRKEAINITLENGLLTLTAERKLDETRKESEQALRLERRYGRFARSLRLGTQIDETGVKANYHEGVLELVLPKAEQAKPRKISVDVNG
ncbi:MAG: Hsp20/alpha crystallin family protein [Gammaproteobacteria bacterium]|nr:Hsp20/alpha crystallin family protein [Gammaproteobacteria bacterium]